MIRNLLRLVDKWPLFLSGLGVTLALAGITVLLGTIIGALIAVLKTTKSKLVQFAVATYVELIRGTPLLLQLYFFYYLLPDVLQLELSKTTCIVIALVVNSSAYVAEIIRSGMQAVDKGQREAAVSLGMSEINILLRILLPQAIKNILPALGNEFIMVVKETSLASAFFIGDLMTKSKELNGSMFMTIEPLIVVGMIYFVVTFTLSKLIGYFEGRMMISD